MCSQLWPLLGFLVWLLVQSLLIIAFDQIMPLFLVSPIPVHFVFTFDDQSLQLSS